MEKTEKTEEYADKGCGGARDMTPFETAGGCCGETRDMTPFETAGGCCGETRDMTPFETAGGCGETRDMTPFETAGGWAVEKSLDFGDWENRLVLGDNLEILRGMDAECVDLIYLDPPFFSNRHYEVIWGDKGEIRSFEDRWAGGIDHYIGWLHERVSEMHRVLKPAGSLYLHCDWHANSYIRVYVLDKIFGAGNFRNEIIWCYRQGGRSNTNFGQKHDTIFWYSKTKKTWTFNADPIRIPYEGTGGYQTSGKGVTIKGKTYKPNELGKIPEDWWDIPAIPPMAKERIGYPTQKPEALLERIIRMASNKGDIVLDPFMGGGTAITVAEKLERRWIGIDQSAQAVKVTEFRLEKQYGVRKDQEALFAAPYTVRLHTYDRDTLFTQDPFVFETWIIRKFGGIPQNRKGGDRGVDGKTRDGTPIQVKQSKDIGVNAVKNFFVSAEQYNKYRFDKNVAEKTPAGYIIAFSFGKGAVQEAARLKNEKNVVIKLLTVGEIVPLSVKPAVTVRIREAGSAPDGSRIIECTAAGDGLSDIAFYCWDFSYDSVKGAFTPQVLLDKTGRQTITLKAGVHHIAVKAVDNDGLENIEKIKVKINGSIERDPPSPPSPTASAWPPVASK